MRENNIAPLEFDEKVLKASKPVVVCFTTHVSLKVKGERACSRFGWVLIDAERRCPEAVWAEFDVALLPINEEMYGAGIHKTLPKVVVFKDGKVMAKRTILLQEAQAKDFADRLVLWVRRAIGCQSG